MILNLKVVSALLIFTASTHAWIFRITSCSIQDWIISHGPIFGKEIYMCTATVESSGSLTTLVNVVGNNLDGKNSSDIQLIRISNSSTFTHIPSNIGNLLPNLIGIDFRAELITSVTAEDLKQFPNLIYLAIFASPIVSLDADLFKYTPNIQGLVVPGNKILNVGLDLLTSLVDLKFVNFLSNPCLSYYASTPEQLQWLKYKLLLRCPPLLTTITTVIPTTAIPNPSTVPVEDCEIRCSLNDEMDELKSQLIKQNVLIKELYTFVSNHSQRIYELERIIIGE